MPHRAFDIPEILVDMLQCPVPADQARVLQVCRSFWVIAAPQLWARLPDFRHLVHLLNWKGLILREASGKFRFARDSTAEDWERFDIYAPMVQWICVQAPSGYTAQRVAVLQSMVDCKSPQALLPNLQGVKFAMVASENWTAWSFLLGKTTRSIELGTRCTGRHDHLSEFMRSIPTMAPHVKELILHAGPSRLILAPLVDLYHFATDLQRVTLLDEEVDEAIIRVLGTLPKLSTARLHLPLHLSLHPLNGFPVLKSLELWGCLTSINNILDHITSRNVQELTVMWDEKGQAPKGDSIRPILNVSRLPHLRELRILYSAEVIETRFITQFIDFEVLAAFAPCSALSVLELEMYGVVLSHADIDALTSNWPRLRRMVVHSNSRSDKIMFRDLEILGKNCPLIEEIDIDVNV